MGPRQQAIINFIAEYRELNGYSPTIREIQIGVNLASPSTVDGHLNRLETNGYITRKTNIPRTILLTAKGDEARSSLQTL
ncbi:hypothetical protein RE628_11310 [Paenibacillus sp. D2_2]|uniref:LexA family protein n=1 Tax=Paenibacillus sp. D2_2 TaxID=3073092 RepID=UPI0028160A99|nr:hypothetical protein [Paenibacillus sp. D2_2]WMT42815.1 hypothetical protein RE628_11310 [Paenibacillus sp. D2_2]